MIKTKELIICLSLIFALVMVIATNVFASEIQDINALLGNTTNNEFEPIGDIPGVTTQNNTVENNTIENNTTTNNTITNNTTTNNTTTNNTTTNNTVSTNTAKNNTTNSMPNTGIESTSIVIIAICIISAVYAYKKIREYNV